MVNKQCKQCGQDFTIEDEDVEFYDRISPVFAGKKNRVANTDPLSRVPRDAQTVLA